MTLVRSLARPMLSSLFVVQGVQALRNPEPLVSRAKPVLDRVTPALKRAVPALPDDPKQLIRVNGGVQTAAGLLLATGRLPRLSSFVLSASLALTTAAGHRFWEAEDPEERRKQRIHFLKNVSLIGGLLIAGVDTEGRPGVAWRTQRAAKDAKRAARTARRQTRLAARAAKADTRRVARELVS